MQIRLLLDMRKSLTIGHSLMQEKDGVENVCEVELDSHGTGKQVTRHLNDKLKAAITRWVVMNIHRLYSSSVQGFEVSCFECFFGLLL